MIKAKLVALKSKEGLSFATFENEVQSFYMLATDLDEHIKEAKLSFKASDCSISKTPLLSSISNEIKACVKGINKGEICCVCTLQAADFTFEAILSTQSFIKLDLKEKDEVYAYVKANALYIEELL